MVRRVWNFCGDMRVNVYLLFLISGNLAVGSYYSLMIPRLFKPLDRGLLQDWLWAYGQHYPVQTWWVMTLLILVAVLGCNTLVCAIRQAVLLLPRARHLGLRVFSYRITPSLIHLCFVVMLCGHLLSMTMSSDQEIPLRAGVVQEIAGGSQLVLLGGNCEQFRFPDVTKSYVKNCVYSLRILSANGPEMKNISYYHPFFWRGWSFHLDITGQPKGEGNIRIIVRKDLGIPVLFAAFSVLLLLMLWYYRRQDHF